MFKDLFIYFWLLWVFIVARWHLLVVAVVPTLWWAGLSCVVTSLVVEHGLKVPRLQ